MVSQTACADIYFLGLAINVNRRMLNVRKPSSSGVPFGVADVVARHSSLGAYFTLGHYLPLTDIGCLGRIDATWSASFRYLDYVGTVDARARLPSFFVRPACGDPDTKIAYS